MRFAILSTYVAKTSATVRTDMSGKKKAAHAYQLMFVITKKGEQ